MTNTNQQVTWNLTTVGNGEQVATFGTTSQNVFGQGSDNIDWGYQHLLSNKATSATIAAASDCRTAFAQGSALPAMRQAPANCNDNWPTAAFVYDLGSIAPSASASKSL